MYDLNNKNVIIQIKGIFYNITIMHFYVYNIC